MVFSLYIESHMSDLSADNQKKYQQLQERFDD